MTAWDDGEERVGACRGGRGAAMPSRGTTSPRLCNALLNFESFKLPPNPRQCSPRGPGDDAAAASPAESGRAGSRWTDHGGSAQGGWETFVTPPCQKRAPRRLRCSGTSDSAAP